MELRNEVDKWQKKEYKRKKAISKIDMISFSPIDNELAWAKERIHDWSRANTERVFDELMGGHV